MVRLLVAVPALVLALAFALHTQAAGPSPSTTTPQRWEYITLFKDDGQHWFMHVLSPAGTTETSLASPNSRQDAGELKLAALGQQGWELVSAVGPAGASGQILYLKRPMP